MRAQSVRHSKALFVLFLGFGMLIGIGGENNTLQAQNVVGVWRCPGVATPWGPADSETILMPDGNFTKKVVCGNMFTWDTGTYTVGKDYIHFKILDHEPKTYQGKQMSWFKEETVLFQFINANTMVCQNPMDRIRIQCYRAR